MLNGWGDLNNEERHRLYLDWTGGKDLSEIIKRYGLNAKKWASIERRLREYRKVAHFPADFQFSDGFEQFWKDYCEFIGRNPQRTLHAPRARAKRTRKVGIIADAHGDLNKRILGQIINGKFDLVIWAGDQTDMYAISTHARGTERLRIHANDIRDEIARIRAAAELIASSGAAQNAIMGNHDIRFGNMLADIMPPTLMFLFEGRLNVNDLIFAGIPNASVVRTMLDYSTPAETYRDVLDTSFLAFFGDLAVGHYGFSRKGDGNTVRQFAEWIDGWATQWGKTANWIVQPHIHGASMAWQHGGHRVLCEAGYAGPIEIMNYAVALPKVGARPPIPGFFQGVQYWSDTDGDWRTDPTSVQFIRC